MMGITTGRGMGVEECKKSKVEKVKWRKRRVEGREEGSKEV